MNIKVFKFGGASVKDAEAVKNLISIIESYKKQKLVIVISAMGKTTNSLEKVVETHFYENRFPEKEIAVVQKFHFDIIDNLFQNHNNEKVKLETQQYLNEIEQYCISSNKENFDKDYDQIVSYGELISTRIIYHYLQSLKMSASWEDARKLIITNDLYREALVDWEITAKRIKTNAKENFQTTDWIVTQGFIASNQQQTTTLGREGSDFTGAIFAWALDAESLTIWKDVPGLLNADPKIFSETTKIDKISYGETVELAYYGATIIHPKTIKPLQNKSIPLYVKSFLDPKASGSLIIADAAADQLIPSFIVKYNQLLISISPRDYSFMSEEHLAKIFTLLANLHIKVNMMQVSAISFSICIDDYPQKYIRFLDAIKVDYKARYNKNLELLTIRHYTQDEIAKCTLNRKLLLEQRSRTTIQLILEQN